MSPFLKRKCLIAQPTQVQVKTGMFTSKAKDVLKVELGIDTITQMLEDKDQVFKDDEFFVEKIVLMSKLVDKNDIL